MILYLLYISIHVFPLVLCQQGPKPDFFIHNITLGSNLYRFILSLPDNTFTDPQDGNIDNLKLDLLLRNGNPLPSDEWIQLRPDRKKLIGYISPEVASNQPVFGYEYVLKATDSDGNVGRKIYNFKMEQRREPFYKRRLILRSFNSLTYVRNNVEILFDIQEKKLLPYSMQTNQGVDDVRYLVTDALTITKASSVTTIDLTWSIGTFIFNQCMVDNIIKLRSKTIGTFQNGYTSMFGPVYQFNSVQEVFTGACSYLSVDPPVIGTTPLPTFTIIFGNYFSFTIPANAFSPPSSGSSMNILLKLQTGLGVDITSSSWINLNGNNVAVGVKLEGFASYSVASKQTSYQFRLVASTPLLTEVYRTIDVTITQFQPIQKNFIVSFTSATILSVRYSSFIQSFITAMSSYLQSSGIIVYSFEITLTGTVLQWTLQSLSTGDCNTNLITSYTSKLVAANGQPLPALKNTLSTIGFPLDSIGISTSDSCNKPVIKNPIGQIQFTWGTFFQYVIPSGAYTDPRDGPNLQFSVLTPGSAFSSNNWISVNTVTRTIYGVPITNTIKQGVVYRFTLRITNSIGAYVDDTFIVQSNVMQPSWSYLYRFRINYSQSYTSMAAVLFNFFTKLYTYFGDTKQDHLVIKEVITIDSERRMDILYFNTSFRVTPCDTQAQIAANMKLFAGTNPHPLLKAAMSPDFNVIEISSQRNASCQQNTRPYVSFTSIATGELGPHIIAWGSIYKSKFSSQLFTDEEDGNTYNLKEITFKSTTSNFNLAFSSWIFYDHTTYTVYAVPMDKTYQLRNSKGVVKYIVRAIDSGGLGVSTEYIMKPTGTVSNLFKVTYEMTVYDIATTPYAVQLVRIYEELWKILGSAYEGRMCIRNYEVTSLTGNNGAARLVWTPCDLPINTCDFTIINNLRNILFNSGSTILQDNVKKRYTYFAITGASFAGFGSCALNPPIIGYQIPTLQVSFCGLFTYLIPETAFIDSEDGNTRNLQLILTDSTGNSLTTSSWLQFDATNQKISALLTQKSFNSQLQRTQTFILTASDKTMMSKSQAITFNIIGNNIQTDYKVILQVKFSFLGSNVNPFIRLAEKIGSYFGDSGQGFEAIGSTVATDGSTIFEFGNCTIQYSPCKPFQLAAYKEMLKNSDGSWKNSFTSALQPEFTQAFISDSLNGPCANDEPPQLINQWGPIQVSISKTFILRVPENMFFDKEQGPTRNLRLELTNIANEKLAKNYWIQFDALSQTLTIVASRDVALSLQPSSTVVLRLKAYDINGKSDSQNLQIIVSYPQGDLSHYISMQLTLKNVLLGSNFVSIFNQLRTTIISYFGDSISVGTVGYRTVTDNLLSTLNIIWFNTTISRTQCENEKLNYVISKLFSPENIISASFISALFPSFTVLNVQFFYDGICNDIRLPPVLNNAIPPLAATFCSSLNYLVPANTFSDKLDGNTRQLTLSLTEGNMVISLNSFIHFNPTTQMIIISPFKSFFTGITFPKRYTYRLSATNKRGLSVSTNLYVDVQSTPPQFSYSFQMSGLWRGVATASLATIINEFQSKTSLQLGYTSGNDVYPIEVMRQSTSSNSFTIKAASCRINYDPCDKNKIENLQNQIFNPVGGTYKSEYAVTLLPNIIILSLSDLKEGPCKTENKPPVLFTPIPTVNFHSCSAINYKLSSQTFKDDEDGFTLNYVLIYINGKAIDIDNTWIYSNINKDIIGIVDNSVVAGRVNGGYQVTIRAFDSQQLFVDATWNINISGKVHQTFYRIVLDLTKIGKIEQSYVERFYLVKYINTYLGGNYTNTISLEFLQNSRLRFTWSSCSLPDYCDPNAANIFFQNFKNQNQLVEQFKIALSLRYTLNDATLTLQDICSKPLNPPIPSRNIWTLSVNQCGGLTQLIPANMFSDSEDGDTRSLILSLTKTDDTTLPQWIYFDTVSQTIYAVPTRQEARNWNGLLKLRATDSTGLFASIQVSFVITTPLEPKYFFTFQYSLISSMQLPRVTEIISFTTKLSNFMGTSPSNIALQAYSMLPSFTRSFKFSDCSISYNPCDLASLTKLRDKFISSNNFPVDSFKVAMQPQYNILFGLTEQSGSCTGNTLSPPKVITKISTLRISLCGFFDYLIPENTFYDPQDGNTRQLTLSLKSNQQPLGSDSWIQFNSNTQTIYGIPLAQYAIASPNGFTYTLTAEDKSKLPAETPVNIVVNGNPNIVSECQLRIDFQTTETSLNMVTRLQYITTKLKAYFELSSESDISIINYVKQNSMNFQLFWSYCSPLYRTSSPSSVEKVDYYGFITKILVKLFTSDRKTVVSSFYTAFGSSYTVMNVVTQFTKRCLNLPPIVSPGNAELKITLASCGYTQRTLGNNLFYDFEDGGTSSLKLTMHQSDGGAMLQINSWVNVDGETRSIVVMCDDNVRKLVPGLHTVVLKATDSKGLSTNLNVILEKFQNNGNQQSPFEVTFELKYNGHFSRPLAYEGILAIQRIKSYYQILDSPGILVKAYDITNPYLQYRKIIWTTCKYQSCSSQVLSKTKALRSSSGALIPQFTNAFLNDFTVFRVYYTSSCSPPTTPPYNNNSPSTIKLSYCSLFSYQLPSNLFFDNAEGDLRGLSIQLFDSNGNKLPKNAFLQLNSANLNIYAINSQSIPDTARKMTYTISVSNSARLTASVHLNVEFDVTPYIADCPITIEFHYVYRTPQTTDLDVLWLFLSRLQSYYKDSAMNIKVLDFHETSSENYRLQWSNCTFSFATQQLADKGLSESDRTAITRVFSKVVDINTQQVNQNFQSALSQYFLIQSVVTSYKCIETNPYPGSVQEYRIYPKACVLFKEVLPSNVFLDEKDVDIRNMDLTLTYTNGQVVSIDEWIQINNENKDNQYLYGTVTKTVMESAPVTGLRYLIKCTDSSGRSATLPLIVLVIQQSDMYENDFLIGFRTSFGSTVPSALILSDLTQRIARFVNPNDVQTKLFVKSFDRSSYIRFSHCDLVCNENTLRKIFTDFQSIQYQTNPSFKLIQALRPTFEVSYVYISAPKCFPNQNETITPGSCPPINIQSCGYFTNTVSSKCFRDSSGVDSRIFMIDIYQNNLSPIPKNSWLQFNIPTQSFYGVPIWNQLSASQTYQVEAMHPASGKKVYTPINFDIDDYSSVKAVYSKICQITMSFVTSYGPHTNNIIILRQLLEKISSFQNPNPGINTYLVIEFLRQNDLLTLTLSNCTWINLLKTQTASNYLQEVLKFMNHYFVITGSTVVDLKTSFREHLKPEFLLQNLQTTTTCTNTPVAPPIPNKDLFITLNKRCGMFTYLIPTDTFTDPKYGTTRKLTLKLLSQVGEDLPKSSWISLDRNQNIYGLIGKDVSTNQPVGGYVFLLEATNTDGQSATTRVTIKMPIKSWTPEVITLKITSSISSVPDNELEYKWKLVNRVESYGIFAALKDNFYVKSFDTVNDIFAVTEIGYCLQCDHNYYSRMKYIERDSNAFKTWVNQRVTVVDISYVFSSIDQISEQCRGEIYPVESIPKIEFKLCSPNEYDLTLLYTSYVEEFEVEFLTASGINVASSSWINLLKNPYRIVAYPTRELMDTQSAYGYTYKIRLKENGKALNDGQQLNIFITDTTPSDGQMYTLAIVNSAATVESDVYYVNEIWKLTTSYLGGSKSIQHVSFTRFNTNPTEFTLSWFNCSLRCGHPAVQATNARLFTNGIVSNEYKSKFPSEYQVQSLETSCSDNPPRVNETLTLEVPACGYYVYKLPNDFAYDSSDGYLENLSVEMKNIDGSELGRSSWIQFNKMRKEIVALPDEIVISSLPTTGRKFSIYVTDSSKKTSVSTLIVKVVDIRTSYMKFILSFQSTFSSSTTFVEIQRNVMFMLANYIGDKSMSSYQTLTFSQISSSQNVELYYYKMSYCAVNQYICPSERNTLVTKQEAISVGGVTNKAFISYIDQMSQRKIKLENAFVETLYDVDQAPTVINTNPLISVNYCSTVKYEIPKTFFSDKEGSHLKYNLYLDNGGTIPRTSWVYMYQNYIYIMPVLSSTQKGLRRYKLEAIDKCGQTARTEVRIDLSGESTSSPYSIRVRLQARNELPYSVELWNIQQTLKECYGSQLKTIRSESFRFFSNLMEYQWTSCSILTSVCNKDAIDKLSTKTFSSPNVLSQTLKNCFKDEYILEGASEIRSKDCPENLDPPKVVTPPIISTTFCQKLTYPVPVNTFHDAQDGNTRQLRLELLTEDLETLSNNGWIQFDPVTQTIHGYPNTGENKNEVKKILIYKLKAIDSTQAYSITDLLIRIQQDAPSLDYYMILTTQSLVSNRPYVDEEIELITKLKDYFDRGNLNAISFTRQSNTATFKFSFCDFPLHVCPCNLLKEYRDMIQPPTMLSQALQPTHLLRSITDQKQGKCLENTDPVVNQKIPTELIPVGQCYERLIPERTFFDKEDGYTRSLSISLRSVDNEVFPANHWIQIENQKLCGILPYQTYVSSRYGIAQNRLYEYNVVARDSCSNEVFSRTLSTLDIRSYPRSRNYLLYMVIIKNEGDFMSNCQDIDQFFTKIAQYTGNNKTDLLVEQIYLYNTTTTNYTEIAWGYRELTEENCSNDTLTMIREKFFSSINVTNSNIIQYMAPEYEVVQVIERKFGPCAPLTTIGFFKSNETEFPWWILWIILGIALLALLLWLLWLCSPRCCPGLCGFCGNNLCCGTCCRPGAPYSSFNDNSNAMPNPNDIESGVAAVPRDEDEPTAGVLGVPRDEDEPDIAGVASIPNDQDESEDEHENPISVEEIPIGIAKPVMEDYNIPDDFQFSNDEPDATALPRKVPSPSPISESSIHFVEKRDDEEGVDYNFSDTEINSTKQLPQIPQQVRTESYQDTRGAVDRRTTRITSRDTSVRETVPQPYRLPRQPSMYIERHEDRTPRSIIINENFVGENERPVFVEKKRRRSKPLVIEERRQSKPIIIEEIPVKKSYTSSRHYRNADALVDVPIVMEVKESENRRTKHGRHGSDGDTLIKRRNRRRSISPIRRSINSVKSRSSTSRRRRSLSPTRRQWLSSKPVTLHIDDKDYENKNTRLYSRPYARTDSYENSRYKHASKRDLALYIDSDDSFNKHTNKTTTNRTLHYLAESDSSASDKIFFSPMVPRSREYLTKTHSKPSTSSRLQNIQTIKRDARGKSRYEYENGGGRRLELFKSKGRTSKKNKDRREVYRLRGNDVVYKSNRYEDDVSEV